MPIVPTHFRATVALVTFFLAGLMLGLPIQTAAQELETATGLLDLSNLNGIQHAGARSYAMDIAQIAGTAQAETPQPEGPALMMMLVARFESPEQAGDGLETMQDHFVDELTADHIGFEIEATGIEDIGNAAVRISGTGSDQQATVGGYIVQHDDWLYFAIAISTNNTSDAAALTLITFALEHQSDPEDIRYDHTGTSTGGLWGKLPGDDDPDATSGTVPVFDNYLLPPEGDVSAL